MRARIFNIMQYEKHPETGEQLITEDIIKVALAHKSLKQYAYICHDEDVYSLRDEADDDTGKRKAGDKKPRHWHIVCKSDSNIDVSTVAKWFGISDNFVDVPKGAGAFLDCVEYLTHEQDKQQAVGKRLYEDDKVIANFDFRAELDKRAERRLRYGKDLNEKDMIRNEVLYHGMTLRQVMEKYPLAYQDDMTYLEKCRMKYITASAPVPALRLNYYVDGLGGIGKNTACKALARALFPELDEEDCYFEIGGDNVSFEGYDGQPVIIWNDMRAGDLIRRWGHGEVFDIFDSHPTSARHNVKYGSVKLINAVNIINGIQPYEEFLDGLAGEYTRSDGVKVEAEDKGQAYRRIPIILCLRENDFDVLLNKGVAEGTREYYQYIGYRNMVGNFGKVAKKLEGKARQKVEIDMLKPALECTEKVKEVETTKISNPDEIPDEFKNYGSQGNGFTLVIDAEVEELPFN